MAKPTRRSKFFASLLAALALSLGVFAFVGPVPHHSRPVPLQAVATEEVPVAVAEGSEDFRALLRTPLRRASDGAEVALTSLWSENEKVRLAMACPILPFMLNHCDVSLINLCRLQVSVKDDLQSPTLLFNRPAYS